MLNMRASPGAASSLENLFPDVLTKLNVRGNGHLRIVQDGHSALLSWVHRDRLESEDAAVDEPLDGLTTLAANRRVFEEALDASKHLTWITQGASGQTPGRPKGSIQFVLTLIHSWRLDKSDAVRLLGYDPEDIDYVSAVLDGSRQPRGRDIRDRITHLFHIRKTLWSLFRDLNVECDWLREEHSILNGQSPLSLILDGSMEDLLLAREYVESAAGIR